MDLSFAPKAPAEFKPRITVIGVGSVAGNAVSGMAVTDRDDMDFLVIDADPSTSAGIPWGGDDDRAHLAGILTGCDIAFVVADGGDGIGTAWLIASTARGMDILVIGIGRAEAVADLALDVHTLVTVPIRNRRSVSGFDSFQIGACVRTVTDLLLKPGLIDLDLDDVRTIMDGGLGRAAAGTGEARGANRAIKAAEGAIRATLLDRASMLSSTGVLFVVRGGADMTLFDVDAAANRIRDELSPAANIVFKSVIDEHLASTLQVSLIVTGTGNS